MSAEPTAQREPMPRGSGELSLKARLARSIFWLAWSRGVLQALSFVTTVLVARILAPADYGVIALASVFIGTAGMLMEMGLGRSIIQFRDLGRRELDTCFWITMSLALGAYAALFLSAPTIAGWFAVPRLAEVLRVLALSLPLAACSVVSDSLLRKRLALDRISQAEIISGAMTLPVILCGALAGLGVWALVIGLLVSWGVRSVATFAFAPWIPGFQIGGERAGEMLRFSLTTLGANLLWTLKEQADVLVIGKITGQVSVGLYTMAKDLALLPTSKISTVVNMLSSPMMAELQTDIETMRAAFYRAVRLTAAIALPASVGVALVADEIVAVLLGPKWLPAVPVLRLLSFYAAVRAIDVLLPPVLFARHRERFVFWYSLAMLIVVPAAAALGALWDGATGAVLLLTPVYCAVMAIMAKEALAELNGTFARLSCEIWPILVATAVMVAIVLLLRELDWVGRLEPAVAKLVVLSVSGAVTYSGVLFAVGRPVIAEGTEVVGWILRRKTAG